MKQVDTTTVIVRRRTRRHHSKEFKHQVILACREAGVSIAGVALSYGLNANLVRRWLTERGIRSPQRTDLLPGNRIAAAPAGEFVPIRVALSAQADIRIEVHRGRSTVTVCWPLEAAGDCAGWLRTWLR